MKTQCEGPAVEAGYCLGVIAAAQVLLLFHMAAEHWIHHFNFRIGRKSHLKHWQLSLRTETDESGFSNVL